MPVTRGFDIFLVCVWNNGWINNRQTGDLRRYRAHFDVNVMLSLPYNIASLVLRDNNELIKSIDYSK